MIENERESEERDEEDGSKEIANVLERSVIITKRIFMMAHTTKKIRERDNSV